MLQHSGARGAPRGLHAIQQAYGVRPPGGQSSRRRPSDSPETRIQLQDRICIETRRPHFPIPPLATLPEKELRVELGLHRPRRHPRYDEHLGDQNQQLHDGRAAAMHVAHCSFVSRAGRLCVVMLCNSPAPAAPSFDSSATLPSIPRALPPRHVLEGLPVVAHGSIGLTQHAWLTHKGCHPGSVTHAPRMAQGRWVGGTRP